MRPFTPSFGWAGDVTPYYADGTFHLFYLKDVRDTPVDDPSALAHSPDSRTTFHHLTTADFETYVDLGPILAPSDPTAQDAAMGTGCIVRHEDRFHLFYSGINGQLHDHPQAVMLASSSDLTAWSRDATFRMLPDGRYESSDWRDPFVFWNEAERAWWMLVATRLRTGPKHRRGCTALATSPDLVHWTIEDPLYAPGLYYTHECPDMFQLGDRWYLLFSTFSHRMQTHYRVARAPRGPFERPATDTLDGRAWYAAKSVEGGGRRVVVGWNPTRVDDSDTGEWQWGGALIAHDVAETPDGRLAPIVRAVDANPARPSLTLNTTPVMGEWSVTEQKSGLCTSTSAAGAAVLSLGAFPAAVRLTGVIEPGATTSAIGFVISADAAYERYYEIRIELDAGRLTLERYPRRGDAQPLAQQLGAIDRAVPTRFSLLVDGTVIVLVLDGVAALTGRAYAAVGACLGLFAEDGAVRLSDLLVDPL